MRPIYRTSFGLRPVDGQDVFADIPAAVADWLESHKAERLPKWDGAKLALIGSAPHLLKSSSGKVLETLPVQAGDIRAWGARFQHPDHEDNSLRWSTEIALSQQGDGGPLFSCSVLLGRADQNLAPFQRFASRPRIVESVLTRFKSAGILSLSPKPIVVSDSPQEVELFVKLLESPARRHPVIFLSTSGGELTCPAEPLASHLAGLAHVIVAKSDSVSDDLGRTLSDLQNCFDGAIRIYWPGFTRRSNPYHHRLYIRQRLLAMLEDHPHAVGHALLQNIAGVAVFSLDDSFLTWGRLERLQREDELAKAKASGDMDKIAESYAAENDQLRKELEDSRAEQSAVARDVAEAREDALRWKETYLALAKSSSISVEQAEDAPITSVAGAIAKARKDFSRELLFELNSKSDKESPFEQPTPFLDALVWLATTYRDAKIGKTPCADLNHSIKQAVPGWSYSGGQSTTSKGKFSSWYECQYRGTKHYVEEHVGKGSDRDARNAIRVGFTWLADEKKVLIGFIGQHQKTSAT